MAHEHTLAIIKPDAMQKNQSGEIITLLEKSGLAVIAAKVLHLTQAQAEKFYEIHKERPFFGDLVTFMIQAPVLVLVLEGENAVTKNRETMGATDPKKALPGTVRALFGASLESNAIHGSDSRENAHNEIAFFFAPTELVSRKK